MLVYDAAGDLVGSVGQLTGSGFELVGGESHRWIPYEWISSIFAQMLVGRFHSADLRSFRPSRSTRIPLWGFASGGR
jgi:hypothetical protein